MMISYKRVRVYYSKIISISDKTRLPRERNNMQYTKEKRITTAKRLTELREEKRVTFEDIAKELKEQYGKNVSVATLKGLEVFNEKDGRFDKAFGTRVDTICALSDYYGVSVAYLLGETDIQSPDVNMKAATEFTGLSEKAIETLHHQPFLMAYTDNRFKPLRKQNGNEIMIRPEDVEVLTEPSDIYTTVINAILEKNPSLLSELAYFIYIDEFPKVDSPQFKVGNKTYTATIPSDAAQTACLENVKDEVRFLRERIEEERKGKNGK